MIDGCFIGDDGEFSEQSVGGKVSAYLQIAETVLRTARRPMSAASIMRKAIMADLVPSHLHGQTQHKTLQARLSEDILERRDHSVFFRTEPGKFFLREFITDASLPASYRQEMTARRRTRQLMRGPALSVDTRQFSHALGEAMFVHADSVLNRISAEGWYSYVDPKRLDINHLLLWAVSILTKNGKVLSYRAGRYRDDRDRFAQKRTLGFSTLVLEQDRTLFDPEGLGIADSGLHAVATDLDISFVDAAHARRAFHHEVKYLARSVDTSDQSVLAFVEVHAPDWFEPPLNKLSLNDVSWLDLSVPPNNIEDFDPWSKTLLSCYFGPEIAYGG